MTLASDLLSETSVDGVVQPPAERKLVHTCLRGTVVSVKHTKNVIVEYLETRLPLMLAVESLSLNYTRAGYW